MHQKLSVIVESQQRTGEQVIDENTAEFCACVRVDADSIQEEANSTATVWVIRYTRFTWKNGRENNVYVCVCMIQHLFFYITVTQT